MPGVSRSPRLGTTHRRRKNPRGRAPDSLGGRQGQPGSFPCTQAGTGLPDFRKAGRRRRSARRHDGRGTHHLFPQVQVGCIPTMHRRCMQDDSRLHLPGAQLVLVDEAHLSIARTSREIIEAYVDQGAVVIGLTATPCRADGAGLGEIYDDLVEGPNIGDLTDQGYLVPARYFLGERPDLDGVKVQAGDFNQRELGERANTVELVGDVAQNWARLARDRQTFVFAVNVAHSRALCSSFRR